MDDVGECIGQLTRIKISINITQLLKKIVFVQIDRVKIPLLVLYEKLPDFVFVVQYWSRVQGISEV